MITLLVDNPLLLLFIVSSLGYLIGQIKVQGSSLGAAAVLFVGLAFGALDEAIELPDIVFLLGLVIFVYTIGLTSGPGFFASFRRKGLRDNLFAVVILLLAAGLTFLWARTLALPSPVAAGLYAGSLTNTPALAGLLDTINNTAPAATRDLLLAQPVTGYAVAYPMGVLGMLAAIFVTRRLWKIDFVAEAAGLKEYQMLGRDLYNRTVRVTNPAVTGQSLRDLRHGRHWNVVFARHQRDGVTELATAETTLRRGDLISLIGAPDEVDKVIPQLGELTAVPLDLDRSAYDYRRIFVSNPAVAGRSLAHLRLPQQYGAIISRVRRGDVDLLARGNTVLQLGDRVRVVARREDMATLNTLFGDSYKALSEINLLSLGIGLVLGLLLGLIPVPLPGGATFRLGFAGGPLIVALILGARGRTGSLVWQLPYSANLTLRQMGLILLLAGIGIRSGHTFFTTFTASGGPAIFLAGLTITVMTAVLTLTLGYKWLRLPYGLLIGVLAGLQTQPAVLGFALEQADNELPNIGYALIFPIATITKILLAQLLLTFLS